MQLDDHNNNNQPIQSSLFTLGGGAEAVPASSGARLMLIPSTFNKLIERNQDDDMIEIEGSRAATLSAKGTGGTATMLSLHNLMAVSDNKLSPVLSNIPSKNRLRASLENESSITMQRFADDCVNRGNQSLRPETSQAGLLPDC